VTLQSSDVEVLLATLEGAQGYVRSMVSSILTPGAALRSERESTLAARARVQERGVEQRLELPVGWAEFVEVDEEIDALLARLVTRAPALDAAVSAQATSVPDVPDVDAAVVADDPTASVAQDAGVTWEQPVHNQAYAGNGVAEEESYVSHGGYDDGYVSHGGYDEEPAAEQDGFQKYDDGDWYDPDAYEYEGDGYVSFNAGDEEEGDEPSAANAYQEPEQESFVSFGAPEEEQGASHEPLDEPSLGDVPSLEDEPLGNGFEEEHDEWAFEGDDESIAHGTFDPYAQLAKSRADTQMDVSETAMSFGTDLLDDEPDPLLDAIERTHAELESILGAETDFDDLDTYQDDPTGPSDASRNRNTTAALQLGANGTARVLATGEDEDDDPSLIELGSASTSGFPDLDDDFDPMYDELNYDHEPDDEATVVTQTHITEAIDDLGPDLIEDLDTAAVLDLRLRGNDEDLEELGSEAIQSFSADPMDDIDAEGDVPSLAADFIADVSVEDIEAAPELTEQEVADLFAQAQEAVASDFREGVLLFSDVLDANPDHIPAYLGRGRAHLELNDYAAAISDFLRAEELAPESPEALTAIGDLYYARKDYRKAISSYDQALEFDPNFVQAIFRRGLGQHYRRQYAAAVEDLERAKSLDPSLANIDTHIARAKKKLG